MKTFLVTLAVATSLVSLSACGESAEDKKVKEDAVAVLMNAPTATNKSHKTLGDCLAASGYPATKKELVDSAQPRKTEDGSTVWRISILGDDSDEFLRLGVLTEEKGVGGFSPEDEDLLNSLACNVTGDSHLTLN